MEEDRTKDGAAGAEGREQGSTPPAVRTRQRRRWPLVLLGGVVVLPLILFAVWSAITLNWTYSRGDRTGFIQKFSQKGWVCKTWEGEIAMVNMPGAAQERFSFSVRNDSIASQVTRLMGSRVVISYEEHRGVPGSCFGDTDYYVTAVKSIP